MYWLKRLEGLKLTPSQEVKQILQRAMNFAVDGDELYTVDDETGRSYCTGCGESKEYGHKHSLCPVYIFIKVMDDVMFHREMKERIKGVI